MKKIKIIATVLFTFTFTTILLVPGCTLIEDGSSVISGNKSIPIENNFIPPELINVTAIGEKEIELLFSEPVIRDEDFFFTSTDGTESLTVKKVDDNKRKIVITFFENTLPGVSYKGKVSFLDLEGNSLSFIISCYGYNPNLPVAVINELRINGSASDPVRDTVEIYFKTGGNPGGMTLFIGTKESSENFFTFPSMEVQAGDYALLHCFPDPSSTGVPEILVKNSASGRGFSPLAYDFQMNNDKGLSGTSGIVTLYTSPTGNPVDGIIYTNRTDDPEDPRLGWTSTIFPKTKEFNDEGFWDFGSGDPLPDFAVWSGNIGGSKRTLCRNSLSTDTDSKADWHTTPTNSWSLGYINSDLVYSK